MPYVDGFVVPVPTKKLNDYRSLAKKASKVWRDHGALEVREAVADDVKVGKWTSFPRSVKLKKGETVVFSWIVYKSRAHRDRVLKQCHGRRADRQDAEPQGDAVRRQAHDLRRLQDHRRSLTEDDVLKIAGIIAALLLVGVLVVLGIAATRPDTFRVARSTSIKAPPEKIFPLINDFRQWPAWSPYESKDPAMKRTFSGAPTGKGAIYEWDGDKNVGSGRIEIADTTATVEGDAQARHDQADRRPQHRRLHARAARRRDAA